MNYQKPVKLSSFALFIVVLSFSACTDLNSGNPVTKDPDVNTNIVFIAGVYADAACYWINGIRINLHVPDGTRHSEADSIALSPSGDVYVAGYSGNTACYWKNGVQAILPVPVGDDINSSTSSIAVGSNGDVYITGDYGTFTAGNSSYVACYWRNEMRYTLPVPSTGTRYPSAKSVAITPEGDVYIVGGYGDVATSTACYWKNRERTDLPVPAGTTYAEANSIVITANGDVYIAGGYNDGNGVIPCIWRNRLRSNLPVSDEVGFSYARDIAVNSKGDVYVVSNVYVASDEDDNTAYYWKNGSRIYLPVPLGTSKSNAYEIAVTANDDVYIIGYYGNINGSKACCWENGVLFDLSEGFANDIVAIAP